MTNLTNEGSTLNTDTKPVQQTQPTVKLESKPIAEPEPAKEVKAVAETTQVKDPLGQFDYTGCQAHVAQDGETLFDVAQKYSIALQQLRYFNHISKATLRIRPNQKIYIPKEPVYVPAGE